MKTNRLIVLLWLPLTLAFLSAGCATKRPLVDTWRDPQFAPTTADKIALTDRPNPSPQDAALGKLLVTELQQAGFALVPAEQADYLLAYALDVATEKQTMEYRSGYNPMMSHGPITPQTDAQVRAMSGRSSSQPERMSDWPSPEPDRVITYRFTSQDIRLYLYTNPKTHAGRFQLVWQGNINVNESVPAGREQALLKTLLGYFGKDQNGPVNLTP